MITRIILVIAICLLSQVRVFSAVSETTNGFFLVVAGNREILVPNGPIIITNGPILLDDRLIWRPFSKVGEVRLLYPKDVEYGVKIELTDAEGKEVQKTALGRTFGTKWNAFHHYGDARIYPFLATELLPDLAGARLLPKPNEMFNILKPGIYTLELQMQMLYPNPKSTNAFQKDVLQFSPIRIPVVKPQDGASTP